MRQLAAEDEGADREIVVRMHVVAASGTVENFVAEDPDRAEARPTALIFVEVEARGPRDEAVGVAGDIGRPRSVGFDQIMTAFFVPNDEGLAHLRGSLLCAAQAVRARSGPPGA